MTPIGVFNPANCHPHNHSRTTANHQGDKVKPTEQTAKTTPTPQTRIFAPLRALLHAQGNGTPKTKRSHQ